MPRTPSPHQDPGVQPERTHLAWTRTALSLAVVGLLALRLAAVARVGPYPVVLIVAAMVGTVLVNQSRRHRRHVAGLVRGSLEPAAASVLTLGGGSALLAALTLVHLLTA